MQIAIIDYGLGNLHSVLGAIRKVGYNAVITNDISKIELADKLILPGVGAFGDGMRNIQKLGLIDPLNTFDYMMPFGSKKIISKPEDAPKPTPTAAASVKVSPELGALKESADSISKPSGRKSGSNVNATTINLPSTERTVPMVGNMQQSSDTLPYKPSVSPSNGNDMYKTHTRSLFNIVR